MKRILVLALIATAISGCSSINNSKSKGTVTANGTIEKLGMSTFQYGTHLLKTENKTYALKSSSINLDTYLNRPVSIKGKKIAGYPVDGGPELIEVTWIKF